MKRLAISIFVFISFLFSLTIATNVLAATLHHSPLLGQPTYGPYYEPFAVFKWIITVRAPGPQYWIAFGIFALIFGFLSFLAFKMYTATGANIKGIYGTARWAKKREIRKDGLFRHHEGAVVMGQSEDAILKQTPPRKLDRNPNLTPFKMRRQGTLLFDADDKHLLVSAPTRSGKGVSVIIPTLFSWLDSAIVYDIKKENFDITSGYRRKFSHVLKFEPASPESVKFNPLAEIPTDHRAIARVQNLCQTITNPDGSTEHDHWRTTAAQLLLGIILYVIHIKPEGERNLAAVYGTLNDPAKPIKSTTPLQPSTLGDMLDNDHPDPDCRRAIAQTARNMLNKAPNEFTSIVSTASAALSLYQDPIVAANTATSDFCINDLMDQKHPVTLYVCVARDDADRMRPLVRLFLEQAINTLTVTTRKRRHRLLLLVDEFPQLGRLETFESQLAFIAGYGIKALLVTQSLSILFKLYGERNYILDNCHHKLILGIGALEDARYVSESLGTYSINKKSVSHSGSIGSITAATRTTSETEAQAHLMTPDELLRLPAADTILLRQGQRPYRGKKVFYYLDPRFKPRAGLPTFSTYAEQLTELPGWTPPPQPKQLPEGEETLLLPAPQPKLPSIAVAHAQIAETPQVAPAPASTPPSQDRPQQEASGDTEDLVDYGTDYILDL